MKRAGAWPALSPRTLAVSVVVMLAPIVPVVLVIVVPVAVDGVLEDADAGVGRAQVNADRGCFYWSGGSHFWVG